MSDSYLRVGSNADGSPHELQPTTLGAVGEDLLVALGLDLSASLGPHLTAATPGQPTHTRTSHHSPPIFLAE